MRPYQDQEAGGIFVTDERATRKLDLNVALSDLAEVTLIEKFFGSLPLVASPSARWSLTAGSALIWNLR